MTAHPEQTNLSIRPDSWCPHCGPVQGVQVWGKRFDKPGVRKVGTYGKQYRYACPTMRCHQIVEPVTRAIRDHIDLSLPGRRFAEGKPNRKKFTPYAAETRRKVGTGLRRLLTLPSVPPGRPARRTRCGSQGVSPE
jgi:DNA (cytosine-5)-methyltransferase 1